MQPADLIPHPEGGRFREVFRSAGVVQSAAGVERSALTHIYFELQAGERSRFHRVGSDEVWNRYRGRLRLFVWDGGEDPPSVTLLDAADEHFCQVVPAGCWQAAEAVDGTALVGCSVAPGFEFDDFELIDPDGDEARQLRRQWPDLARFIDPHG